MTTLGRYSRLELPALGMWLLACFIAAGVGSFFTTPALHTWYATLHKPSFSPPNWVFGTAWTVLYILMAVAAWLVWRQRGLQPARLALGLFVIQLVLNALWPAIFFGMHAPGGAMLELVLLWLAVAWTLVLFWRVDRLAGVLMIPYLAWLVFAGALNGAIIAMN